MADIAKLAVRVGEDGLKLEVVKKRNTLPVRNIIMAITKPCLNPFGNHLWDSIPEMA